MDKNKEIEKARAVFLQAIADFYIRQTCNMSFAEKYPNVHEKKGVLTNQHEMVLKAYLVYKYALYGLDLPSILKEKGEEPKGNEVLTEYEKNQLIRIADEYIFVIGNAVRKREKALSNKQFK